MFTAKDAKTLSFISRFKGSSNLFEIEFKCAEAISHIFKQVADKAFLGEEEVTVHLNDLEPDIFNLVVLRLKGPGQFEVIESHSVVDGNTITVSWANADVIPAPSQEDSEDNFSYED